MGRLVIDIFFDPVRRGKYMTRLKVDNRRADILREGKNLLVKGRFRWFKKRAVVRLEPVFLLDADSNKFELVGVQCSSIGLAELPWRFKV